MQLSASSALTHSHTSLLSGVFKAVPEAPLLTQTGVYFSGWAVDAMKYMQHTFCQHKESLPAALTEATADPTALPKAYLWWHCSRSSHSVNLWSCN